MTKRRASGVDEDLVAAFDAAWERGLEQRIDYSFIKTYRPVIDDVAFRSWATTADYRRWCEENVPAWLGFGRARSSGDR